MCGTGTHPENTKNSTKNSINTMKKRNLVVEDDEFDDKNGRILFLKCQNQSLNSEILVGKGQLQAVRDELDGKRTQVR